MELVSVLVLASVTALALELVMALVSAQWMAPDLVTAPRSESA